MRKSENNTTPSQRRKKKEEEEEDDSSRKTQGDQFEQMEKEQPTHAAKSIHGDSMQY